jgi:hypothetical protein
MGTTDDGSFEVRKLSAEATESAARLGEWLPLALFKPFENYEVCVDNIALVENSKELLNQVEPLINVYHPQLHRLAFS